MAGGTSELETYRHLPLIEDHSNEAAVLAQLAILAYTSHRAKNVFNMIYASNAMKGYYPNMALEVAAVSGVLTSVLRLSLPLP